MFGSTCMCERTFSILKQAKSENKNRNAHETLNDSSDLLPLTYWYSVAARGEIGREGCEISSLVEHMGLSPWLFL